MENVNLVNIKIINDKIANIEILYKTDKNIEKLRVYLKTKNNYFDFDIKQFNFSKELYYYKLTIDIEVNAEEIYELILEKDNQIIDNVIFLDNKDERINKLSIPYKIFTKKFVIIINDTKGIFTIKKKKAFEKFKHELSKIYKAKKQYNKWYILNLFKGKPKYYLLNDRIMYGNDNAEQLFKYINKEEPKLKKYVYFVLDKNSPNFEKISKIGKTLKFGSLKHKIKYINSKMIISSHASYYDRIFNPFSEQEMLVYKDNINKKFVFLQHGVIMNEIHNLLNREHILADLFVTTTKDEYEEVKQKYMYDEDQIIFTGLARFDKLKNKREKIILIAPTWRAFLTDAEYSKDKLNSIEDSEFFQKYKSLLNRKELIEALKKYGYKLKFLLHPASENYEENFLDFKSEYIEILTTKDIRYSKIFEECALFITDYSSTHFDVAFLQKPIIYYQFDQHKFFSSHYNRGYFEYSKNGFGDLIEDEDNLINKIIFYLKNNCTIEKKYLDIIKNTFYFLDCNNSKRIIKEIKKLDEKKEKNYRFNDVH